MIEESKHSTLSLWLGLFLTVVITVIKGGVPIWVSLSWVSLCCAALCLVLALKSSSNLTAISQTEHRTNRFLNPVCLFIVFQAWTILQYFFISPDKTASLNKTFIGFGMICLLVIWQNALKRPDALSKLFNVLITFSLIQALYGLWVYLSGADLLLWMPKLYYLDRPTGFFVNANHFAAYLVLGIILCLAKIMSDSTQVIKKSVLIRTFDQLYNPNNAILCLLIVTLIASKSIGAMVSLMSVLLIIGVNALWRSENRKTLLASAIAVCFVLSLLILSLDYTVIKNELSGLPHTFFRRIDLSIAASAMLENNWLTGIGGGSFYSQFSPYRTLEVGNAYYNYAHNDILQLWVEYGLIGLTILLMFVGAVIRDNIRVLSQTTSGIRATFAYASIYSTIAVSVHSLVDFPLHMPGFSVCYLVIISTNSLLSISPLQPRKVDIRR